MSHLRKCLANESSYVPHEDILVDNKLNYIRHLVEITDRKLKRLRNKEISQVKIQWKHSKASECVGIGGRNEEVLSKFV